MVDDGDSSLDATSRPESSHAGVKLWFLGHQSLVDRIGMLGLPHPSLSSASEAATVLVPGDTLEVCTLFQKPLLVQFLRGLPTLHTGS